MRLVVQFIFSLIITVGLAIIYQFKTGPLPPLGKFFSPFEGFWQNAEPLKNSFELTLPIKGLTNRANISYDDRLVPHIFAQNEADLYFLQGFVTAQHRLWQMDMQVRVAAGRLSEIIGASVLKKDLESRRIGLKIGAERSLAFMNKDPKSKLILDSYSDGVNAFIHSLTAATMPLEYKLLDFKPEDWSPIKTALLLKYMANMLTGYENDFENTNAVKMFGIQEFNQLFPAFPDTLLDPVIPIGTLFPKPVFIPDTPSSKIPRNYVSQKYPFERPDAGYGSNNWAVSGSRSASGKPILCNDPHLGLNLPSIWFEIQLNTPTMNVYGASIPGAPCVISGFNDSIAWGITNASADVKDWYTVQFKDKSRKEYLYDGVWKKSGFRIEQIKIRGEQTVIDTIVCTIQGPVSYDSKFNAGIETQQLALRWSAHDPSNELLTFYELNIGSNYNDYVKALGHYWCPGQNFVFASADNSIAIWHQGKFVNRYKDQGKFVMDGSNSSTNWQGFIPQEHNPHILNPERGWVSSANQHPTDQSWPYEHQGIYEFFRNRRINQRLSELTSARIEDMMKLQNDNYNLYASEVLPILLKNLNSKNLSTREHEVLAEMNAWAFDNDPNLKAPVYFETWWGQVHASIWDEFSDTSRMLVMPNYFQTIRFLNLYPNSIFIDDKRTEATETLNYLVTKAFHSSIVETDAWKKSHSGVELNWANFKNTTVLHLSQQLAFSVEGVQTGGNAGIVNATSHRKGPSWRMVVSPGSKGEAFGIYPGGQSGNPGSKYYSNFIDDWAKGKYYQLLVLTPNEQHERVIRKQTYTP